MKTGNVSKQESSSKLTRRSFVKAIAAAAATSQMTFATRSLASQSAQSGTDASRPNIVFILADDLGYGSLNSYGADKKHIRTPHIDRIANSGMRFTDAYAPASICTPTRYGFLMGEYCWRTHLKSGVVNPLDPLLPDPDRVSIAGWLKERDYNTAMVGKWHLGYGSKAPVDLTARLSPGPLEMGFDYHFGVPQNHGDMWGVYVENDRVYGLRSDRVQPYSKTYYGTPYVGLDAPQRENKKAMEDLTNKSIEWLRQQSREKPFFLYFAAVAVHHPITPSDYMRGMSDAGPYGDFIQDLDMSVGRIIETLKYMNLMDNTIIIFSSDNGGDIPGNDPQNQRPENQAIALGLEINGQLRGDKHTLWEGGTRVPFIVSWPGKVKPGTVSNDMISIMDIFGTVCEITDGKLPASKDIAPDSFSFLSSLTQSEAKQSRRPSIVMSDVRGRLALRKGNWKYIDNTTPQGEQVGRRQLYDLAEDPSETVNLYESNPEIAKRLSDELDRIQRVQATR